MCTHGRNAARPKGFMNSMMSRPMPRRKSTFKRAFSDRYRARASFWILAFILRSSGLAEQTTTIQVEVFQRSETRGMNSHLACDGCEGRQRRAILNPQQEVRYLERFAGIFYVVESFVEFWLWEFCKDSEQ